MDNINRYKVKIIVIGIFLLLLVSISFQKPIIAMANTTIDKSIIYMHGLGASKGTIEEAKKYLSIILDKFGNSTIACGYYRATIIRLNNSASSKYIIVIEFANNTMLRYKNIYVCTFKPPCFLFELGLGQVMSHIRIIKILKNLSRDLLDAYIANESFRSIIQGAPDVEKSLTNADKLVGMARLLIANETPVNIHEIRERFGNAQEDIIIIYDRKLIEFGKHVSKGYHEYLRAFSKCDNECIKDIRNILKRYYDDTGIDLKLSSFDMDHPNTVVNQSWPRIAFAFVPKILNAGDYERLGYVVQELADYLNNKLGLNIPTFIFIWEGIKITYREDVLRIPWYITALNVARTIWPLLVFSAIIAILYVLVLKKRVLK
ncbi:MAG: hypothetical protein QXF10_08745 [Ignisphaera sp.]